eukprot:scaffold5612_cov108-Skeletonema_dohrnii-CCMP3373.AAC.2
MSLDGSLDRHENNTKRNGDDILELKASLENYLLQIRQDGHSLEVIITQQDRSTRSRAATQSTVDVKFHLRRIISHKRVHICSSIAGALPPTISCVDVTQAWWIHRKASPLLYKLQR